jgi:hypothetical protein
MSNGTFDLNEFIKESTDVLKNPKSYFSTLKTTGGMSEPLIKAVIYGAIAGVFAFLWSLLKIGAVTGGLLGGAAGIMVFVGYIFTSVIGLFIGAVFVLIISSICKGNTDFEANVRVTATLMVVLPISAALGFAAGLNIYLGVAVGLLVNVFSLWLLYNALVETLKAKPETSKIVLYILIAIIVLFSLIGLGAKRKANQFMNEFNKSDMKELLKDMENK